MSRSAMLLLLFAAVCAVAAVFITRNSNDALDLIEGKWELDPNDIEVRGTFTCDQEPLVIEINKDNLRYTATRGMTKKVGDISRVKKTTFFVTYEDRDISVGEKTYPESWLFLIKDRHSFDQIRTDWIAADGTLLRATPRRIRCK